VLHLHLHLHLLLLLLRMVWVPVPVLVRVPPLAVPSWSAFRPRCCGGGARQWG
jgi:hypothetical protein